MKIFTVFASKVTKYETLMFVIHFPVLHEEKHDFIQPLICKVANELMNQSDQTPFTIYTVTLMDMFALKSYF